MRFSSFIFDIAPEVIDHTKTGGGMGNHRAARRGEARRGEARRGEARIITTAISGFSLGKKRTAIP